MRRVAAVVAAVAAGAALVAVLAPRIAGREPVRTPEAGETLTEQVRRVAGSVARLRELEFETLPEPTFVEPERLRDRVRREVRLTRNEAAVELRILQTLGLADQDLDLGRRVADAVADQVVGLYRAADDELVIASTDPGRPLDAVSEITLAHELDHALTDQRLPRPGEGDATTADAALAAQAVLEGDATLLSLRYLDALVRAGDRRPATPPPVNRGLEEVPLLVHDLITFPYTWGRVFAERLVDHGGWAELDRAYRDPPTTTFEILYPDRWRSGFAPTAPSSAPETVDGLRRVEERTFGAAELLSLYAAPGDDPDRRLDEPYAAVSAWRGGRLTVYAQGDRSALALRLRGEPRLCADVEQWYARTFPPAAAAADGEPGLRWSDGDRAVELVCDGREVRLGLADTAAVAAGLIR